MNPITKNLTYPSQERILETSHQTPSIKNPYQTFIFRFLLGILASYTPYSFAEVELIISGHKYGKDRDTFTMISSYPESTSYIINRKLILSDFSSINKFSSGGAFKNLSGKISFLGKNSSSSLHFKHINLNAFGSESNGGIFTAKDNIIFKNNHYVAFRNNIVKGNAKGCVSFADQRGAIIFANNQAIASSSIKHSGRGGAISGDFAGSRIIFLNNQQITFEGNSAIQFFDPVIALTASIVPVEINAPEYETPFFSPKGAIVFSRANLLDDAIEDVVNRTSIFNQPVYLHNGTLSIENGAHLVVQSFKQIGGRISLSPGSSLALYTTNSFFYGNVSSKEPLEINDLSFGVSISPPNLQAKIHAGSAPLKLSGTPTIYDSEGLFYENRDIAASPYQMEIQLSSDKVIDISDFTTSSLVASKESGFQGSWHFSWKPNTINNTKQKILRASWIPTGEYVLEANRIGRAVPNSLWSTFLLLQVASHNLGEHLCNNTSLIPTSYFGVLIGGTGAEMRGLSSEEESRISRLGATGTTIIRLTPTLTLSGGGTHMFGDSWVTDLPEIITSEGIVQNVGITQTWEPFSFNATLCAALDHNSMIRICSKKDHTRAMWDTFGIRGTLGTSYTFLGHGQAARLFSFVNVEATNILQKAFTETGYNPRSFAKTKLINIAIPVGIGYEFYLGNDSLSLLGKGYVGYSRDIKQENPKTLAHLAMNDFSWISNGCPVPVSTHTIANQFILRYKACSLYVKAYAINRENKYLSSSLSCGGYIGF